MAQKPTSELVGREVVGFRDDKIGKIDELCFHGDGQEPTWALVKMGVLGTSSVLIPLHDAEVEDVGAVEPPAEAYLTHDDVGPGRPRDEDAEQTLEPMGASDRKVVHDVVAEIEGVSTTSEGEEPRRRVVIRPG